jgi:hypothetical protein
MSSDEVSESQRLHWIQYHWPKIVIGVIVIIIGIASLSLWPKAGTLGQRGTLTGGRRVERGLQVIERMPKGSHSQKVYFSEKDMNGYFEFIKKDKLPVKSVSVKMEQGFLRLRVSREWNWVRAGSFQLGPRITYDLVCQPAGGMLGVRKVWMGHLSLSGGAKASAIRKVYSILSKEKEWAVVADVDDITIDEGKMLVVFKKK